MTDEFQNRIQQILDADTDDFMELAILMRRDPLRDYAGANLEGVNLSGKNLQGANLSGANLRGAILRDASLRNANLSNAILCQADLKDADLRGADLTNISREGSNFEEACLDEPVKPFEYSQETILDDTHSETFIYSQGSTLGDNQYQPGNIAV